MNPIKAALWIAKFVAALVVLLVILPAVVWVGGSSLVAQYHERKARVHEKDVLACVVRNASTNESVARPACDADPTTVIPPWNETFGSLGIPTQGIPYLNRQGRFYGADYCSTDGWGIPAGQIDDEHADHVDDPACRTAQ